MCEMKLRTQNKTLLTAEVNIEPNKLGASVQNAHTPIKNALDAIIIVEEKFTILFCAALVAGACSPCERIFYCFQRMALKVCCSGADKTVEEAMTQ